MKPAATRTEARPITTKAAVAVLEAHLTAIAIHPFARSIVVR